MMKRVYSTVMLVAVCVLSACTLGSPAPTLVPTQAPATEVPATATEAAVLPTEAPTELVEAPIDLAGPPMEVGSKYLYLDGSVLAAVPGGPFLMGNNNFADTPEKEVTIGDFWIYSSEVTNSQYALCVRSGKCSAPAQDKNPGYSDYRGGNLPVVGVNYQQAVDYCTFAHGRLPTEAEWEKAARGPEGNLFPWGNAAPTCNLLNYNFCKGKTLDIQSYPDGVSFYGLFDMSGNVYEWVADWYSPKYYTDGPSEDPLGPELGDKRSVRSSSFTNSADFAFASRRSSLEPKLSNTELGFRCVVEDPTFFAPSCEQLAFVGTGPNGAESDCVPEVYCNDVGVSISELQCSPGDPDAYSIVNFSVDAAPYDTITMDAPGCVAGPGAMQFTCQQSVAGNPAKATGACYDKATCDPVCAPHYTLVGDTCQWDGSGTMGTECLPGMTYDPLTQCCSADPGSGMDYDVCPAGSSLIGGMCIADPAKIVDVATAPITYDSCSPPGETPCDPIKDPSCKPDSCGPDNPVTCTYPLAPNQDGCSCYCLYGPGKCN